MRNIHLSCEICGRKATVTNNRPKSLHKTTKITLPNLQKFDGLLICNRCRRTLAKAKPATTKI